MAIIYDEESVHFGSNVNFADEISLTPHVILRLELLPFKAFYRYMLI